MATREASCLKQCGCKSAEGPVRPLRPLPLCRLWGAESLRHAPARKEAEGARWPTMRSTVSPGLGRPPAWGLGPGPAAGMDLGLRCSAAFPSLFCEAKRRAGAARSRPPRWSAFYLLAVLCPGLLPQAELEVDGRVVVERDPVRVGGACSQVRGADVVDPLLVGRRPPERGVRGRGSRAAFVRSTVPVAGALSVTPRPRPRRAAGNRASGTRREKSSAGSSACRGQLGSGGKAAAKTRGGRD